MRTVKYSGNPKISPYHYIRTLYNSIYRKNITDKNFTTKRVIFWCLLFENYILTITYTKWCGNEEADDLRRLQLISSEITERNIEREILSEIYCVNKLDGNIFPLTYQMIDKYQRKDKELVNKLKHSNYHTKSFPGGGKVTQLICRSDGIVVP